MRVTPVGRRIRCYSTQYTPAALMPMSIRIAKKKFHARGRRNICTGIAVEECGSEVSKRVQGKFPKRPRLPRFSVGFTRESGRTALPAAGSVLQQQSNPAPLQHCRGRHWRFFGLFSGLQIKTRFKRLIAHCHELCINAALGASLYCWC